MFDLAVFAITAAFGFYCLAFLLRVVDIAPELSDSGYYLLMHRESEHIDNQLTQMGTLLKGLIGEPSIIVARYINYIVVFISPAISFWLICRTTPISSRPFLVASIAIMLGVSNWAYFKWLLLDPSYNSLVLAISAGLIGFIVPIGDALGAPERDGRLKLAGWSMMLGAAMLALGLVKATTAVLLFAAFSFVLVYTTFANVGITLKAYAENLSIVIFGGILGGLGLLLVVWANAASPATVYQTMRDGFEAAQKLGVSGVELDSIIWNFSSLLNALRTQLGTIAYPTLTIIAVALLAHLARPIFTPYIKVFAIAALVFLAYCLSTVISNYAKMSLSVWGLALVICPLAALTYERRGNTVLLAAVAAFAPFAMVFGSFATWHSHIAMFVGTSVLVFAIVGAAIPRLRLLAFGMVFVAGGSLTLSAMEEAANNPYRLGGTTQQAIVEVIVGGERFRATPSLSQAYEVGLDIKRLASELEDPSPILLDMTGRAPTLHWITGFAIPSNAWILSGYPGSDALLDWSLQRVEPSELADAWIIIDRARADGTRYGLSVEVLNQYLAENDVLFPDDFVHVRSALINYMNFVGDIYAPRRLSLHPVQQVILPD